MQGRAPRAQPTAPQARGTRARPPSPAKISARGRAAGEHDEGKGGKPPRNRTANSAPRHGRRCGHRPSKRPEARRGRAGRAQRPRASPSRGRMRERGQRPSRPDRRRKDGQRARELPHLHPTPQHGRDHASGRRRGGEAGGDGAGRAALGRDCWPSTPLPSAQSAPLNRASSATGADGSDEHGAQAGGTAAGPGTLPPRAQSSTRPSGRATGQATGRTADGRDGAAGAILAACSPLWRFFSAVGDISCHPHARTPQNGEKSLDLGLVLCALIVLYLFGGV